MRKRRRRLWIILGLAVAAFLDYWIFPAFAKPGGRPLDLRQNGLWLRYTWAAGRQSEAELAALSNRLRVNGIRDAYFHVRGVDAAGHLKHPDLTSALTLNRRLALLSPNVRRIAWIYAGNLRGSGKVDLTSSSVRYQMAEEARRLVREGGFDGVQWDYEICDDGDADFLKLLEETRRRLPSGGFLGIAAPTWYPPPITGIGWSAAYYAEVARRVDQIAVMAYDSAAYSPRLYVWWVSQQVVRVTQAVGSVRTGCRVVIGVPTYDDGTLSHNPRAENLRLALIGVRDGLSDEADRTVWQGVALFADYTTSESEWREFQNLWAHG